MQKNIGSISLCIFFFLMLILPTSFQEIRGVFLLMLLFFGVQSKKSFQIRYNFKIAAIWVINILFSIFFIINGIIRSNPGAIPVSTVYLLWPVIYFLFIGLTIKKTQIVPLLNTIIYGGLASILLILIFIYNNFFGFPVDLTYLVKVQDFGIYWESGAFELNSMNLATVLYCFVFVFTILIIPSNLNHLFANKKLLILIFFMCSILIFISARRAFWLVCLLSPLIIIVLLMMSKVNLRIKRFIFPVFIFIMIAFSFVTYLSLDNENIISQFESSFEFDNPEAESNYIRKEQYDALINGWSENKFFGAGLGASAKGSIRDDKSTWAYELSYIALLYHVGIVGMIVYGASILWIIYESIMICRINHYFVIFLLPQITSLICFLLITATNPYLLKFDYLWVIFLPLATINALKLEKNTVYE
jgi:hypothetical protein